MLDPVRQEVLTLAQVIVVKVGTNVITRGDGTLDVERVTGLVDQVQRVRQSGRKVVLVSSGAIGAGVGRLALGRRPTDLRELQAAAAVGQSALMGAYEDAFLRHGCHTAQILLTAGDFENRGRYLNARNTILKLLDWNCVPIINENDTVTVAEIRFGDNDQLAAMVTNLLQAPLLILLSVVDGLYAGDPGVDPQATLLRTVTQIDDKVAGHAGTSKSALGTGGMKSKLQAARLVTASGESVIIANGSRPAILDEVMSGAAVGTLFLPHGGILSARERWIGMTVQPRGRYLVDAGARTAVQEKGKSLLAIGVVEIEGAFHKGDVVAIADANGVEFARGLTNYSAADAHRIKGLRSEQIAELLGPQNYDALVHRDNLVVTLAKL
jgi:glutamate 5-kinase